MSGAKKERLAEREKAGLPPLPAGIPLVLEIDPSLDLEFLRDKFDFEIIAEHENGYVIVAAKDIDLTKFVQLANGFAAGTHGAGKVAQIRRLLDDSNLEERLALMIPDERLRAKWPFEDETAYLIDISIACIGTDQIPSRPNEPNRGRLSDRAFANKQARHALALTEWTRRRVEVYDAWEQLKVERYDQLMGILSPHGTTVLDAEESEDAENSNTLVKLPDSFTVRFLTPGKALRDLVLNFPSLFEVVEAASVTAPLWTSEQRRAGLLPLELAEPPDDAPTVCVIDSGIQEGHRLLSPGIDSPSSRSYLPADPTNVADEVPEGGHGTRVAGAVLYGESVPISGRHTLTHWVQNARVLDASGALPSSLLPAALLASIVRDFHHSGRKTRLFNLSLTEGDTFLRPHMPEWAAAIDLLSAECDILFVVAVGNVPPSPDPRLPGVPTISDHLAAGRNYPDYLNLPESRLRNPAHSFSALTVGSVAYPPFSDTSYQSIADDEHHPSSFTRTGYGMWDSIKPEVVECGGDYLRDTGTPPQVSLSPTGNACYPQLVRSTLGGGPEIDRDSVGTSYATPKVSHIVARLAAVLPDAPCSLYKALVVQSARWPAWAASASNPADVLRQIGYGIPDLTRATTNSEYRTTLVTARTQSITDRECHLFQVPIPSELRAPGKDFLVLVEVTLVCTATPRRTRRNPRRYLSTWVDWRSSRPGESLEEFHRRVIRPDDGSGGSEDEEKGAGDEGSGTGGKGKAFQWMLHSQRNHGVIRGTHRSTGTTQKDWAFARSYELPSDFCIAVVGHQGWNVDPDAAANYVLAVSLEVVGKEVAIYDRVRVEVDRLRAELEVPVENELEIEVPGD